MTRLSQFVPVSLAFALASVDVFAATPEDSYFEAVPIVLSASRVSQPVSSAPAPVTVLDRALIEASGARTVPEIMRLVPGVQVGHITGYEPVVTYHGLSDRYARRMQVLVDGRSIYTPLWGGVQWEDLPLTLDDIERIEVVRGPNAATFGANAFLGVINIITRHPDAGHGHSLRVEEGDPDVHHVVARFTGHLAGWRGRTSIMLDSDHGLTDRVDDRRRSLMNLRASRRLNVADELEIQFALGEGIRQGLFKSGSVVYSDPDESTRSWTGQLRWNRTLSSGTDFFVQASHWQYELDNLYSVLVAGAYVPAGTSYDTSRSELEFQYNHVASPTLRLMAGSQLRRDGVYSKTLLDSTNWSYSNLSRVFGNVDWSPGWGVTLHAAATYEDNAISGGGWQPRTALLWQPVDGHTFRLSTSRGFRTPTFLESRGDITFRFIHPVFGAQAISSLDGNRGLRDEEIRSREFGYVGNFPKYGLSLDLRRFIDRMGHLIETTGSTFGNLGHVTLQGVEGEVRWQPSRDWLLRTGFSRTRSLRHAGDIEYPDAVPYWQHNVLVSRHFDSGWQLSGAFYLMRPMTWLGDGNAIPEYKVLDVRLSKDFKVGATSLQGYVAVQNAYEHYVDFGYEAGGQRGMHGSTARAGVVIRF